VSAKQARQVIHDLYVVDPTNLLEDICNFTISIGEKIQINRNRWECFLADTFPVVECTTSRFFNKVSIPTVY